MRYLDKYGYIGQNKTLELTTGHTCTVKYAKLERLKSAVEKNLSDIMEILKWNLKNNIYCFRIGSKFIPLGGHPEKEKWEWDWRKIYAKELLDLGSFIKNNNIRITMHPDHFVVLNSPDNTIVENSIRDLQYHADLLDAMDLDYTHKMQIHTGGLYNNKSSAISRWITTYKTLDESIKRRLVLENDDHIYDLHDVLYINSQTGVPILFDTYHNELFGNYDIASSFEQVIKTWKPSDGNPLLDYSNLPSAPSRKGTHGESIDFRHFKHITKQLDVLNTNYDIILEIGDKDLSALKISSFLL